MGVNGEKYPGRELSELRAALEEQIPELCRPCHLPRSIIARGIQEMYSIKDDPIARALRGQKLKVDLSGCFENDFGPDCPGPSEPYYKVSVPLDFEESETPSDAVAVQCQAFATTSRRNDALQVPSQLPDPDACA